MSRTVALALALLLRASGPQIGAQLGDLSAAPRTPKQYVTYAGEAQIIPAGKPAWLELRFRVNPGFHVNSHTPKSELLIPTRVDLAPIPAVHIDALDYPAGKVFAFSFDPSQKLDVYQDDFTIRVPVTSAAGDHELKGALTYQACDHAACYPPRKLPVDILFTAR